MSANQVSGEALCHAMNRAFSDYSVPMKLSEQAFSFMMRQRGLDLHASRIAIIDGQIAAIWLVAVRGDRAYLISSGTTPEFRRQGLARRLAEESIADLEKRQIVRFQTEVLTENTGAFELYASLGMSVARTLQCYDLPSLPVRITKHDARRTTWAEIQDHVPSVADTVPSWQNNSAAIDAVAEDAQCWSVVDQRGLAGYVVLIPENRSLAQIGVRNDRRREGVASDLLDACHTVGSLRLLNVDTNSEHLRRFLKAVGAVPTVAQYEMVAELKRGS